MLNEMQFVPSGKSAFGGKKSTLFFVLCVCSTTLFSQNNITNTLGTGGVFSIKDATTNYLTLTQSSGEVNILKGLRLENTSDSSLGVIFKGADRFIHNYGAKNTFMGTNSGNFTMTGTNNTAVGFSSINSNTTGTYNAAVGSNSLHSNTTGFNNTALGYQSLYFNTTGYFNTASGIHSLIANTTGFYNTASGSLAGSDITTGSNLTCLGFDAEPTSGTATNQITLGNGNVTSLRCAVTTITALSDARDKKNINDLNLGIDFLMKIKPRLFNWDKRECYENNISDGSKMKEEPTAGFIAQELDEVQTTQNSEWLNLVLKDNPEKLEATPGNLLPIMVKAIQDLKKENDELKAANDKLKNKVENVQLANEELKVTTVELTDRLINFEQMQNALAVEIEKLKTNNNETTNVSLGEK